MNGDMMDATQAKGFGEASGIYTDGGYLDHNASWHVEDSPWKAAQIIKMLRRNDLTFSTVAEVGCGGGEILRQLSLSFQATTFHGYELSPQAFELSRERASERVHFHLKNLTDEETSFDCLLCIDVFEHVEDYIGFLKVIRAKARYKIFHIPLDLSVSSVLRVQPILHAREAVGHLHYFSRETALATLRDCGYEIVDSFYTRGTLDLPSRSIKRKLANFPRRILHALSPDLAVRLLGGCSLMVLAR